MLHFATQNSLQTAAKKETDNAEAEIRHYNTGNPELDEELETLWQMEDSGFRPQGYAQSEYEKYLKRSEGLK